jgi:hypothetical protein
MWGISEELKTRWIEEGSAGWEFLTPNKDKIEDFLYRIKEIYNDGETEICGNFKFQGWSDFLNATLSQFRVGQNIIIEKNFRDNYSPFKVTASNVGGE